MPAGCPAGVDGDGPVAEIARRPDALAVASHPAFAPLARWWVPRRGAIPPDPDRLDEWARAAALVLPDGRPVSFRPASSAAASALAYERRIAATGEVATRQGNLHDACNALAWLAFPRTKAALNSVHVNAAGILSGNGRDRRRDAATLLDESGLIVACADASLVGLWRTRQWRAVFWDRRDVVSARMRAAAIGHGLMAKLVAPYRGITVKALVLPLDATTLPSQPSRLAAALDAAAAATIDALGAAFVPEVLLPLPVAALPGWDIEARGARLFDDTAVFRPPVLR